jgi:2-dehydro-3-deoxyphosphogluconate aldolase/(4S)-4-hydroxy-2-oxoglutarate aldolase
VGAVTHRLDAEALMTRRPVIPILTIEDAASALPLARALADGGLDVMEVTLRTSAALTAIRAIAEGAPEIVLGAGTILGRDDLARALDAGARFIVTPGLTDDLIEALATVTVPILPGVATASDLMRGLDAGLTHFKFFPAEASGGAATLAAFQGPFATCRFCPTGGVNATNAPAYFALSNVLCVGGAWVAPPAAIRAGDWASITALAREAAAFRPAMAAV